ncbi:Lnp1 protein [Maudiozyma humilis]|uniref:Endoplasmic reticulum junction formation protein lunapark n=1 Tax=Maudiozyma humilis TaxID=51915 RepID=A0AAV5RT08_MAUHU|nr:Lnp1 protein [Kazachstania humilis]
MLGKLGSLLSRDRRTVVQRYTQDLSQITGEIHSLEKKLTRSQATAGRIQSQLTTYGLALTALAAAYVYASDFLPGLTRINAVAVAFLASVVLLIVVKWTAAQVYGRFERYQQRKLSKLKAVHQKKLNELKKETNFHETSSIIQRFSSGDDQSDDALILIDDELKDKYTELQKLKSELEVVKQKNDKSGLGKDEKDVWFDRVIGVLAGGNDLENLPHPVVCPNCKKHAGAYRIAGKPLLYVCPYCEFRLGENIDPTEGVKELAAADTVEAIAEEPAKKD